MAHGSAQGGRDGVGWRRNRAAALAVFSGLTLAVGFLRKYSGSLKLGAKVAVSPERGTNGGGRDPQAAVFRAPERQELFRSLQARWAQEFEELSRDIYPDIARDPFFNTDTQGLLLRYLSVAGLDVDVALARLRDTARWRSEWDMLAYYEPGVARALFSEELNPGSEMYFADSLGLDAAGRPFLAGRLKFANAENMHPWRHLRAGVFVFEMMANKVAALGHGPASYVLDIGPIGVQGSVSGSAGLDRVYDERKNPYYKAGAGTKDAPSMAMVQELGELDNGFAVLKAAIRILNRHYPGFINKVYYLNSDMLFWGAFKIFSRWISDRGAIDFSFLGPASWREEPLEHLLERYPAEALPPEWGGTGPALDGDSFLARAIDWYEAVAKERTEGAKRSANK